MTLTDAHTPMTVKRKWGSRLRKAEIAEAKRLLQLGMSSQAVAERLGVSYYTIYTRIRDGSLPKTHGNTHRNTHRRLRPDELEVSAQMLAGGASLSQVAHKIGVSTSAIRARIRNGDLPAAIAGTSFGGKRLSRVTVDRILFLYEHGATIKSIKEKTGHSYYTIKGILTGEAESEKGAKTMTRRDGDGRR